MAATIAYQEFVARVREMYLESSAAEPDADACAGCGEPYALDAEADPTPFCHSCAQTRLGEILALAEEALGPWPEHPLVCRESGCRNPIWVFGRGRCEQHAGSR